MPDHQPSLLDRLTDNEPDKKEPGGRRVISLKKLRQGVLRDLEWLLNCVSLESTEALEDYPHVENSVLNYGGPSLSGATASGVDVRELERRLRQAIVRFEPRIMPNTVKVRAVRAAQGGECSALAFEISGELWSQPVPEGLLLRTDVDLESGRFAVTESADQGRG